MTTMNREELTNLTKAQLAELTAFAGNLKNTKKETLIDRALELMAENTENTENKEEDIMTIETTAIVAETETTEPKAEKKVRTKKTYERLIMDLPTIVQTRCVCERSKKSVAIHVKLGKKRVFAYDGVVIIVNRDTLLDKVVAEKRNYGYRVAPTRENMLQLLHNAGVC